MIDRPTRRAQTSPTAQTSEPAEGTAPDVKAGRRVRVDVARNLDALLQAAKTVFAKSGVDAPVRDIAEQAGVGVGTVYRHFPQRADLIAAVFQREIDACADAAPVLAAQYPPFDALAQWLQRFAAFVGTKRGLATALHSGDAAFDRLRPQFDLRMRPAFLLVFDAAVAAGEIRSDVDGNDLLSAVASLCMANEGYGSAPGHAKRMVALLVDGLRYRSPS